MAKQNRKSHTVRIDESMNARITEINDTEKIPINEILTSCIQIGLDTKWPEQSTIQEIKDTSQEPDKYRMTVPRHIVDAARQSVTVDGVEGDVGTQIQIWLKRGFVSDCGFERGLGEIGNMMMQNALEQTPALETETKDISPEPMPVPKQRPEPKQKLPLQTQSVLEQTPALETETKDISPEPDIQDKKQKNHSKETKETQPKNSKLDRLKQIIHPRSR